MPEATPARKWSFLKHDKIGNLQPIDRIDAAAAVQLLVSNWYLLDSTAPLSDAAFLAWCLEIDALPGA